MMSGIICIQKQLVQHEDANKHDMIQAFQLLVRNSQQLS